MFRAPLAARLAVVGVAGLLLAACGTAAAPSTSTTPTASSSSSSSSSTSATTTPGDAATTTTTTMPLPSTQVLQGTAPWGSVSRIGSVHRVAVVPVPSGALAAPAPPPGGIPPSAKVVLAFRRFGSGPDLLLIAGEHATMTTWDPRLLLALGQHYRVTIFDLPGVGYSGAPLGSPDVASFADDVAGLINEIGLIEPTVLGWGLGGEVALALAERHAGLASRLVLADTTAGGPRSPARSPGTAAALASGAATNAALGDALFPSAPKAVRSAWLAAIALFAPDDLLASSATMLADLQSAEWSDPTLAAGLHLISIPVLVVHGSADEVFPQGDSAVLVDGIRHARALVLAAAGYGAIFEDEATFVPVLENFTG